MGTNRALKFLDDLETLLNKAIRFNLSGPLLLQAYEMNDNKDINVILTHKNLTDDYLTSVRKIVDDDFNVPEADYNNLIDNIDNSILFPNFILSSKPIDFENVDKKICSNAYLIFPRSFKICIANFARNKALHPLNDVYITKEEVYSDINGVLEKYLLNLDFNTSSDYELFNHNLKKCLLPYTADLSEVLKIEMIPSVKLKNYPPIIKSLFDKVINGGENLLATWNLTNENLEAYFKGIDYLFFIPPGYTNNDDKHYVYIYKDLIKGKTKTSKLYPIYESENAPITNNALVIEYNNLTQYLFYRHFDIDIVDENSSVRGFF